MRGIERQKSPVNTLLYSLGHHVDGRNKLQTYQSICTFPYTEYLRLKAFVSSTKQYFMFFFTLLQIAWGGVDGEGTQDLKHAKHILFHETTSPHNGKAH